MRNDVSAKKIGKRIQKLRLAKGRTTVEAAEDLNMTRQHLNHLEAGRRNLTIERLTALTQYFGVKPDAIVGAR